MSKVVSKNGKVIRVIEETEKDNHLSESDIEMDARAVEAVRAAIAKANFLKKSIAKYDDEKKAAYIEYVNGEKKYTI